MLKTNNLELARMGPCAELRHIIEKLSTELRKEVARKKKNFHRDYEKDHRKLERIYEEIKDEIFETTERENKDNDYHSLSMHILDSLVRGEDLAKSGLNIGFLGEAFVSVIKFIMVLHDILHPGTAIGQTIESNISNEEKSAIYAAKILIKAGMSPLYILHIISGILGTSFGQGHLDAPLKRKYKPNTFIEKIASFADIGGFFYKKGFEDDPFAGFMEDSFLLIKEKPMDERKKDFDEWIGSESDQGSQIWFVKTGVEILLEDLSTTGILDSEKYDEIETKLITIGKKLEELKSKGPLRDKYLKTFKDVTFKKKYRKKKRGTQSP